MDLFSIKDVERLSGIKAHTFRIWEQRYGLVQPHRKESKHRFYTNEDLKEILRVAFLYTNGFKVSKIAQLSPESRSAAIDEIINKEDYFDKAVDRLLVAGRHFDEEAFARQLKTHILQAGFETAITQLAYPYLEKIGLLWMNDHVHPAQEHFGSQIIQHQIIAAIDDLPRTAIGAGALILLFAPEQEFHEIPLLFIHYLLRKQGKPCIYLGINIQAGLLESFMQIHPVTHLYYHQVTNFTQLDAAEYLIDLCTRYPNVHVVASGMATMQIGLPPANARLLRGLPAIMDFASQPLNTP
jgi:MerR family transcriptional regulator, light-induced transcriptional regulator